MDSLISKSLHFIQCCKSFLQVAALSPLFIFLGANAVKAGDIQSIDRPIFESSSSPTFKFSYQLSQSSPDQPILIFFQGGPGAPILGGMVPDMFPKEYGTFLFDPRGTGLSGLSPELSTNPQSSSSIQIAEDVLAVIKKEKIRRYAIWANSYGTVTATIFASLVSKDESVSKPMVVVLEGVVGRAFALPNNSNLHEVASGYKTVLDQAASRLSDDDKNAFANKIKRLHLSQDVIDDLFEGVISNGVDPVVNFVKKFSAEEDAVTQDKMNKFIAGKAQYKSLSVGKDYQQQMKTIGCNEIINMSSSSEANFRFPIFDGRLSSSNYYTECADYPVKKNIYDSKNYQVASVIPIVYLVASDDPNTPPFQAKYHLNAQMNRNPLNTLIETSWGGHFPLQGGPLVPCRDKFWTNVAIGSIDVGINELKKCSN